VQRQALIALLALLAGLAEAAPFAYVPTYPSSAGNEIKVVDQATRSSVASIAVASGWPLGVAVSPRGDRVYVAHPRFLSVIDAYTNTVVAMIDGLAVNPGVAPALSPDGSRIYIANDDGVSSTVDAYDPYSREHIARIPTPVRGTSAFAINSTATKAYVAGSPDPVVVEVDLRTGSTRTLTFTWPDTSPPSGISSMGLNPEGTRLYLGLNNERWITVVDVASFSAIHNIFTPGWSPSAFAFDPSRSRIYVRLDSALTVLDAATDSVVATFSICCAGNAGGLALYPSTGDFIYIPHISSLLVMDARTLGYEAPIEIGEQGRAAGNFIGPALIAPPPPAAGVNWALASNGGTASASSIYSDSFPASGAIDDNRTGSPWAGGDAWNDGTPNEHPDALQVLFNSMKTIDRVVIYTAQDDAFNPVEPTDTMTFSMHGIQDFTVEAWTGSAWVLLGAVTGNNLVKRTITFPPVAIDRIYVNVTRSADAYTYIAEVEAWQSQPAVNVALASTGAYAFASSEYSPAFPASAVIDGDRAGRNWGMGSGWNDGTAYAWPDWMQVVFNGQKTIDRVVVYTLQDNVTNPSEPTDSMQFSLHGIQDFSLEGWTGTNWVPLGKVYDNRNVKRTVTFPPIALERLFVYVTRSLGGYSHITEVEASGN